MPARLPIPGNELTFALAVTPPGHDRGMCDICNGTTIEQALADIRGHIRSVGWALQGVEPEPGIHGWTYTVGLLESYDHPELLVVDDDVARAGSILNVMGRAIRDGDVIAPGDPIDLGGTPSELIDIHPVHLTGGLMATWHNLHAPASGGLPLELEAYQLVVAGPLPGGELLPAVRLDDPTATFDRPDPGRAA